ncbi:MAG: hypothetical protein KA275_04320 [Chitinophagaceae bacterium]|nr:hypothetical protein [Chitinophagaceae bacterium]
MSDHVKKYDNWQEMLEAIQIMSRFQKIHNIIRPDFQLLLSITEEQKSNKRSFDSLYRACLTRFFTLIEADIFGLNQLDIYSNYDDKKDKFIEKFKETFKQICKTWNKVELQKKYFDTKLQGLIDLKKKRDELIHPKSLEHIHKASDLEFEILKNVFGDYDKFINDLMNNFFLGTTIPMKI